MNNGAFNPTSFFDAIGESTDAFFNGCANRSPENGTNDFMSVDGAIEAAADNLQRAIELAGDRSADPAKLAALRYAAELVKGAGGGTENGNDSTPPVAVLKRPEGNDVREKTRVLVPMLKHCATELKWLAVTEFADVDGNGEKDGDVAVARLDFVTMLRQCMIAASAARVASTLAVKQHQLALPATTRAGYLRRLEDLIGGPPSSTTFRDEWLELRIEAYKLGGPRQQQYATEEYVREHNDIEGTLSRNECYIAPLVAAGWKREDAELYILLSPCRMAIARALAQGDPCYAASTHRLNDAIFRSRGALQDVSDGGAGNAAAGDDDDEHGNGAVAPDLYVNLSPFLEAGFSRLEEPDRTGFQGLTTTAIVKAFRMPGCFTDEGYCHELRPGTYALQDADVICFRSRPDDDHGAHTAIMLEDNERGCFPLNTLFRLREVYQPGTWEAPNGTHPKRKLLVVTATYHKPDMSALEAKGRASAQVVSSKMCGVPRMLQYEDLSTFVNGLDTLLARPPLSMKEEFVRDVSWTDWKGKSYTLAEEWAYVTGPAVSKEGCTPGHRDKLNHGKLPTDFLKEANDLIRERRAQGHGTNMPEDVAYLTLDEMLSVRLYSGPPYQVINGFLREISAVNQNLRLHMAEHPRFTYVSTVGHLCSAIRKLAAVATPEEAATPLWRGVRGTLPESFWVPDEQDILCAVDMAFMSTSRARHAPIAYMSNDAENVMWALRPQVESDTAYHYGADIAFLSQFGEEREVLFPPCTMLQVLRHKKQSAAKGGSASKIKSLAGAVEQVLLAEHLKRKGTASSSIEELILKSRAKAEMISEGEGKKFLSISVLPRFL